MMPSPLPSQSSLENETESSKTVSLDFQSFSNSTQPSTTPVNSSEEFVTPCNSLKNSDFDEFKKQIHEEYMTNSFELQNVSDDTLKHNQPIDPSRINDSLKFYGDNVMSRSYGGEESLRVYPSNQSITSIDPMRINDTFNLNNRSDSSQSNHQLRKCGSASSWIVHSESENGKKPLINRSKSGPDWCENSYLDSEDNSETLKPITMRRNRLNIRMDCYGDLNVKSPNSELNGSTTVDSSSVNSEDNIYNDNSEDGVVLRKPKTGSTAIKRRSGNKRSRTKLKRRCSINGHYYNRETSFFTPPYGSQMSVWVTSLVSTQDVINLLLEKYKVESNPKNFALFIVRDNGEQRRLKDDDFPLIQRIMLGPHEDVARLFLTDSQVTTEISYEVAQFLNLSELECKSILDRYDDEMNREVLKVKDKHKEDTLRLVPPDRGTPGRKKFVRFADVLGLDLADVKTLMDEIPTVPLSAYADLHCKDSMDEPIMLGPTIDRILMPLFPQRGGIPGFLDLVREQKVCLENAVVTDPVCMTITGCVRVRNLDFNKSVHLRYSLDGWKSFADFQANYVENSCEGFSDKFSFTIFGNALQIGLRLEMAVRFSCKGEQFWDSNFSTNYCFQCLPATNLLKPTQSPTVTPDEGTWSGTFY